MVESAAGPECPAARRRAGRSRTRAYVRASRWHARGRRRRTAMSDQRTLSSPQETHRCGRAYRAASHRVTGRGGAPRPPAGL